MIVFGSASNGVELIMRRI